MDVVILLKIYLVEYAFPVKEDKLESNQCNERNDEWKTLVEHISCECRCEFDGRKCNSKLK